MNLNLSLIKKRKGEAMKRMLIAIPVVAAALLLAAGCAKKDVSKIESANAAAAAGQMPEMVVCSIDSAGDIQTTSTDSIPKFEYKGKTYYFSSKACRDAIVKDPDKYLGSE
jgi:YHS domain-containing protein